MKAAFLIRCSTKNQDLDRQTRDLTRLAKSLGYEYDIENLVFGAVSYTHLTLPTNSLV